MPVSQRRLPSHAQLKGRLYSGKTKNLERSPSISRVPLPVGSFIEPVGSFIEPELWIMTATTIAWFHPWPSVLLPLAMGQGLLAQIGIEIHMNHFHCTLYQVSILNSVFLHCSNKWAHSHCISIWSHLHDIWDCLGAAFQLISLCVNLMTFVAIS